LRKALATLFVIVGAGVAVFGAASPASADHGLVHFDLEGGIGDQLPEPGGPLACVDPYVKVFGQVIIPAGTEICI
jgi:hypothetical protein